MISTIWPVRLSQFRISTKLVFVVALPILLMIASFSTSIWSTYRDADRAEAVAEVAQVAPYFTAAVHELQRERGSSALMLGAKGSQFRSELQQQRDLTDKALAELDRAFTVLVKIEEAAPLTQEKQQILASLSEAKAARSRIDGLSLAVGEMATIYTAPIVKITALLQHIAKLKADPRIVDDARALVAIAEAKERAGRERALASNGFAAGRFDADLYRGFLALTTAQTTLFDQFLTLARPELAQKLTGVLASDAARAADALRQVASGAPFGSDLRQVSASDWFAKSTVRIDLLKSVEDAAGQALVKSAEAVAENQTRQFRLLVAIALAATLGSLIATIFMARGITKPIAAVVADMTDLARGVEKTAISGVGRRDEIGDIANALLVFQENAERVRALEAEERKSAQRRLQAADSMASIVSDVGDVVAAAAAGDFSARLQITDADPQMQKLVAGINEINAVVDSATTEFAQSLQAVAEGDLTQRIDTAYRGRFADLKGAINETVDRLSQTVRTIQLTSADVGLAAREINMGADDLSKRTEEQASSLEETAATTEELAASVKASAQASREAAAIADEAKQAALAGGAIAGQAVDAMARIESASKKISDIIRVIDDIAFQTNLLALNAAVEAARAGDAGKGFAVVASEVRTLAQRSGEAAKDISALISSSNMEVGEGVKLVRQAGESLERILAASQKVAATIADISSASGEQANGIDEMSQAVAHLDEMTQQNAALAEQSAASAGSLSGKIGQLNDLVAAFRTGQDSAALTPVRAAAPVRAPAPRKPASEPERLRAMAETAFAPARAPAKKVVNSRAGDAGWEEF